MTCGLHVHCEEAIVKIAFGVQKDNPVPSPSKFFIMFLMTYYYHQKAERDKYYSSDL